MQLKRFARTGRTRTAQLAPIETEWGATVLHFGFSNISPSPATLEITLIGPELIVDADTTMAIAGGQFEATCDDRPLPLGASLCDA